MEIYKTIGVMSGTSLDGLDIAYCIFIFDDGKWTFQISKATTISYDNELKKSLVDLPKSTSIDLAKTNVDFGYYIGAQINKFIQENKFQPDFIASHGHTVFHQPNEKYTLQIGDGNAIAATTGLPVIYDFRSLDMALGGQGAPLVPIGDRLLFDQYDFCLNLGGFANISLEKENRRIAFDICPVNIVLNELAKAENELFDNGGKLAESGNVNLELLNELNKLDFYKKNAPKSLGREWVEKNIYPLLKSYNISNIDLLSTYTEHAAIQLANVLNGNHGSSVLITGGGAFNSYLMNRLQSLVSTKIHIPEHSIVEYKEALVFAFLGLLRMRNEINCLSSVTGASRDSSCGLVTNLNA